MAVAPVRLVEDRDYARSVALVLVAGVLWSIAGLVVRLMNDASEWQILFYRSVFLIVALITYLTARNRGGLMPAFSAAGANAVWAGLFLGLGFASWIFAMTHTTIANALFILASSPLLAALVAKLLLGEAIRRITMACMIVSMLGIALMVGEGVVIGTLAGNLMALGASFAFALFTVTLRKGRAVDMTPAVCWAGIWAMLLAAMMLAITRRGFIISSHDLALCGMLGFVQVGLGLILFIIGSRHIPAGELTLLSMTEVVLGPVWVWIGVGEVPTRLTIVGGLIVLGAISAQALSGVRRRPPVGVV
jgi:drug/metabolite transporter (DMT)-like permease